MKIAFIGTGVMGQSMAKHLMDAGHDLIVFTRTKAKAKTLLDAGAHWADTVGDATAKADVVMTMVGFPKDVDGIYFGPKGIIESAKPHTLLIDFTTSSPLLAKKMAKEGIQKNLLVLDAPVSGGDVGARNATLSIMVGGSVEAFEKAKPLLEVLGKNVVLQGEAGSGQHCKMCNQIAIAGTMLAVCEALTYAENSGLNPENVLKSISSGAAGSWTLSNLGPRMLNNDFAPGFYIKHFLKDMRIALDSAREMNLKLPALELAESLYEKLSVLGLEDEGTQALFKLYANTVVHSK